MYRSLNADKIVETISLLSNRISERFPNSGLSKVSKEILQIAHQAVARATWIERPNIPLRIGIGILVLAFIGTIVSIFASVRVNTTFTNFSDLMQGVEASFNLIVLISAAIFFLVTLEIRIKRKQALKIIHELRAMAHIVDIHQLTKDPERITSQGSDTASSPTRTMSSFELSRYLDYCSESLSLIGKLAALYAQHFDDHVVLEAVDEIEDLTTGLSRKIWQKIMIVHQTKNLMDENVDI
jgi:hypothetical protein